MIALLLALQATPSLGALGRQQLPAHGCAAFLWTLDRPRLAAMASAEPAQLRLALDGAVVDLPRTDQHGAATFGFAATSEYRAGTLTATLSLTVTTRADLSDGASVPAATLTVTRAGEDTLVVPLAGLIGCAR